VEFKITREDEFVKGLDSWKVYVLAKSRVGK
jgi:hypothetical protein